jgi:hypothetical protein
MKMIEGQITSLRLAVLEDPRMIYHWSQESDVAAFIHLSSIVWSGNDGFVVAAEPFRRLSQRSRRGWIGHEPRECGKLEPDYEQRLADEGLVGDTSEWPEHSEAMSSGRSSTLWPALSGAPGGPWSCLARTCSMSVRVQ